MKIGESKVDKIIVNKDKKRENGKDEMWDLRACLKTNVNKKRASVECSGIYTLRIV